MLELLFLAIAPGAFLLWYIWRRDCYEPEPLHLVLWIFILGGLSVIPAVLIEYPFPEGIFSSSVVAPVVEEAVKFLVVFLFIYRHKEFDEPMDGIVYAAAASLGFATIENIFYVLEGGLAVGLVRAVLSVPGHVIFSCIWGYALGIAKFRPASSRPLIIGTGLILAMLLHAAFNFSLEYFELLGLLLIIVVIVPLGWLVTSRNIRSAHADQASACSAMSGAFSRPCNTTVPPGAIPGSDPVVNQPHAGSGRYCTNCGAEVADGVRFCPACGKEI